jgi:hypothetical protein
LEGDRIALLNDSAPERGQRLNIRIRLWCVNSPEAPSYPPLVILKMTNPGGMRPPGRDHHLHHAAVASRQFPWSALARTPSRASRRPRTACGHRANGISGSPSPVFHVPTSPVPPPNPRAQDAAERLRRGIIAFPSWGREGRTVIMRLAWLRRSERSGTL